MEEDRRRNEKLEVGGRRNGDGRTGAMAGMAGRVTIPSRSSWVGSKLRWQVWSSG